MTKTRVSIFFRHILGILQRLHPGSLAPDGATFPATVDPTLGDAGDPGFWDHLVRDAIQRFPRASAAGPSGLRPSHLQDTLRRPGGGMALVAALAKFSSMWIKGELPMEHGPLLCGANLTPSGNQMEASVLWRLAKRFVDWQARYCCRRG